MCVCVGQLLPCWGCCLRPAEVRWWPLPAFSSCSWGTSRLHRSDPCRNTNPVFTTFLWVLCCCCCLSSSVFGGYFAGRLYRTLKGHRWKKGAFCVSRWALKWRVKSHHPCRNVLVFFLYLSLKKCADVVCLYCRQQLYILQWFLESALSSTSSSGENIRLEPWVSGRNCWHPGHKHSNVSNADIKNKVLPHYSHVD